MFKYALAALLATSLTSFSAYEKTIEAEKTVVRMPTYEELVGRVQYLESVVAVLEAERKAREERRARYESARNSMTNPNDARKKMEDARKKYRLHRVPVKGGAK